MTISEPTLNQLMNARYLFYLGKENLESGQTTRLFAGVNLLHDAVEAVLWAVVSHTGKLTKDRAELIQLYDDVDHAIRPENLSFKPKIIALNKLRINSKHYGICPDKREAVRLLPTISEFLADTARKALAVNLWTIGYSDLLQDGEVKQCVAAAQNAFEDKDYLLCLTECRKVVYLLFEGFYDIRLFRNAAEPAYHGGLGALLSRAPYYMRDPAWIEKNVQSPFDYIQLDHDALDKEFLKIGVQPSLYWNIWRGTPKVYRMDQKSGWMCKRDLKVEANLTEEHATFIMEQTFEIALRYEQDRQTFRVLKKGNFVLNLRNEGGVNIYAKADRSSAITHTTDADTHTVDVEEGCAGLDGGFYWKVSHLIPGRTILGGGFMAGYVHEDDVVWKTEGVD